MQLKKMEKRGDSTALWYELTWPIGWEQLVSFADAVIRSDFSRPGGRVHAVWVGFIAGAEPTDVTPELKAAAFQIKETAFSLKESGYITIAGYSHIMEVPMHITLWNQTNRFLLQLTHDAAIEKCGEHCYDKYVDSIEIMGHIDYVQTQERKLR